MSDYFEIQKGWVRTDFFNAIKCGSVLDTVLSGFGHVGLKYLGPIQAQNTPQCSRQQKGR